MPPTAQDQETPRARRARNSLRRVALIERGQTTTPGVSVTGFPNLQKVWTSHEELEQAAAEGTGDDSPKGFLVPPG